VGTIGHIDHGKDGRSRPHHEGAVDTYGAQFRPRSLEEGSTNAPEEKGARNHDRDLPREFTSANRPNTILRRLFPAHADYVKETWITGARADGRRDPGGLGADGPPETQTREHILLARPGRRSVTSSSS